MLLRPIVKSSVVPEEQIPETTVEPQATNEEELHHPCLYPGRPPLLTISTGTMLANKPVKMPEKEPITEVVTSWVKVKEVYALYWTEH